MKILHFTIIKLSACLGVGIVLAYYFPISLKWSFYGAFSSLLTLGIALFVARKQFIKTIWFGLLTFSTTILLGVISTNIHNQKNHKKHYTNTLTTYKHITFRVQEVLKPSLYNDKYVISILKLDSIEVSGKALLYVKKDSLQKTLRVDEILITPKNLQEIYKPLNPNQFDYKKYLEKQYIYHQIYSNNDALFRVSDTTHTLIGYASSWRDQINTKLKNQRFTPEQLAIMNALILGQRQDISKEIYTDYVHAGAIHILAVSGLHVGILLLLLNMLFKPLENLKHGRIIKMLLILILLWLYAIIAGASASIIRAATMFSIVAISMHLKRPSNIYNTLAISIFFILLFKPLFLFDVGFQLSYLAVLAIVSIQPLLYKLWKPRWQAVDKVWQIFTVTMAAQCGVLPISLYYFHQFPGLFWLSNIIIIPFIGMILGTGILVIVLALLDILPSFLANVFGGMISFMNAFFKWIASKEQFLVQDISFNTLYVLSSYCMLIALVRLHVKRNYGSLVFVCLSLISLQTAIVYTNYTNSKDTFIVFHKSRNTVIGIKRKDTLRVFHNIDSLAKTKNISTYAVANYIHEIKEDSLQDIYFYKNHKILIIDSLGIYQIKSIKPDYVLLRNSPKINLERLIDSLQPKGIIADGSNYLSYITRWEATCLKRKLPFHQTGKKGAFILSK